MEKVEKVLLLIVLGAAMTIVAVMSFQTESGASSKKGEGSAITENNPGVERRSIRDLLKDGPPSTETKQSQKTADKNPIAKVPDIKEGGDGEPETGAGPIQDGSAKTGSAKDDEDKEDKMQVASNVTDSVKTAFFDFEKDPSGPGLFYTVRDADTFSEIIARYCGSAAAAIQDRIVKLNEGMDVSHIRKGDKILFPEDLVKNLSAQLAKTPSKKMNTEERGDRVERSKPGSSYRFQDGDTLWGLAVKRVGKARATAYIKKIRELNPTLDVMHLVVGKSIRLPD